MVSDEIKDYTKANPYELRWRFDFDNSLITVCNINGDKYDKCNLSDRDKELIEIEYCYLKSLKDFIQSSGCLTETQRHELAFDNAPSYIDYVNLGWANKDGNTYSSTEYWETSNGVKSFAYEEFDAPLSEEGLFQFGLYTFPCMTRVIENGIVTMDYREDEEVIAETLESIDNGDYELCE